jgi:immune inhibitor A
MTHSRSRAILPVLLALLALVAQAALAVPAHRNLVEFRQPDGRTFRARLWGDERHHGHETDEGFTVERDVSSGYWHYVRDVGDGGVARLVARPGIDAAPVGLQRGVRPQRPSVRRPEGSPSLEDGSVLEPQAVSEPAEFAVPTTGSASIPVILVNFSNTATSFSPANFHTLLFTGSYNMAAYYQEVSYGSFTVGPGPEGIGGWYQAVNAHDYYGQNVSKAGDDQWPGDLVHEAVAAADAASFDFAPYDQDGDCLVDNVVIIHQGGGEEIGGAATTNIWSHSWDLNSAKYYNRSNFGAFTTSSDCPASPGQKVRVNKYTIQPELYGTGSTQTTIGVIAHEFGHALGLPDLYDTDGSSEGAGDWTLMASGSWNGVSKGGDRPAHFGPWEKWRLGWITPTAVTCPVAANLPAASGSSAGIFRLLEGSAAAGTGEYFLVENRQNTATAGFDDGLPGHGLLIWHVDGAKAGNTQECWPGPATPPPLCSASVHYKARVVQADNLWHLEKRANQGDSGDPFPGASNRTSFGASTSPNSNLYSGSASGVSVTAISASGATMTATLSAPGTPTLSVSRTGTGAGTVTSSPAGISCGSTCSAAFACGTTVSLTAAPALGSAFAAWSADCSGTGACSLLMDRSRSVTAAFGIVRKLTITDVSVTETSSGTKGVTFTVTRDP